MPPSNEAPLECRQPAAIDGSKPLLEIDVRKQAAAESRNHRRRSGQAAIRSIRAARANRRGDGAQRTQERSVKAIDHRLTRGRLGIGVPIEQRSLIAESALTPQARANRADPPFE